MAEDDPRRQIKMHGRKMYLHYRHRNMSRAYLGNQTGMTYFDKEGDMKMKIYSQEMELYLHLLNINGSLLLDVFHLFLTCGSISFRNDILNIYQWILFYIYTLYMKITFD